MLTKPSTALASPQRGTVTLTAPPSLTAVMPNHLLITLTRSNQSTLKHCTEIRDIFQRLLLAGIPLHARDHHHLFQ